MKGSTTVEPSDVGPLSLREAASYLPQPNRRLPMRPSAATLALILLTACTTVQEIRRPGGRTEYQIACGASLGWNICYKKANELCPAGYETVAEQGDINRKELRIA